MDRIIAFIAYESPWFPAGGIAAVMGQLPSATEAAAHLPTVVVTPLHLNSAKIAALQLQEVEVFQLPYESGPIPVTVLHCQAGCSWYFLKINHRTELHGPIFAGTRHPYDVSKEALLRDSLLFGAAVAEALPAIARHRNVKPTSVEWNLIAQDWEAATALLAFSGQWTLPGRCHLTLHNSYDEFASTADLSRVGIEPSRCPGGTILQRALSIVEQPAFTVSDQFALDFTQDLVQREVMAPHLQADLNRSPVFGVDNGPFKALALADADLRGAAIGDFGPLQRWKSGNREKALIALDAHTETEDEPVWGDKSKFRRDESPWFVMAGRDDPRQKGYDVAAASVESYLAEHHGKPDCAQFLFFPIPGDEGLPGLEFLKTLAADFPQDVLVFPFIWAAGFTATLQGAAFGLMPSLYEPFGMANEFYLAGGCVGIGRATGGNLEQIVPLRATSAFSRAVQVRADRCHGLSAHPTGILFRERDGMASACRDWQAINDAQYDKKGGSPSRVGQRRSFAVFREMATELQIAVEDGIRVYRREPELYYRMLAEGVAHIQRTFSWQRAGQEYARKVAQQVAARAADGGTKRTLSGGADARPRPVI
jgi:glycosyltransferase involved in cell wall biosynthesis